MVEVARHIALKRRINDLPLVTVPPIQSEHVAAVMKAGLADVGRGLAQDLAYVLDHGGMFGAVVFGEQTQLVDRAWADEDCVAGRG